MKPRPPNQPTEWFAVLNGLPVIRIGFSAVAQHRAQIERNHGATLEELNAAGGLDWFELYCGFTGQNLFPAPKVTPEQARAWVIEQVQQHALPPRK